MIHHYDDEEKEEQEDGDNSKVSSARDDDDVLSAVSVIMSMFPEMPMPGDSLPLRAGLVFMTYIVAVVVHTSLNFPRRCSCRFIDGTLDSTLTRIGMEWTFGGNQIVTYFCKHKR